MGGLGNQLFEIFATLSYAFKNKDVAVFPYSPRADNKRAAYWDSFLSSLKPFTTFNPKYNITNAELNAVNPVQWMQHHYVPFPEFSKMQITRLYGYFQSYKYFDEHKETLFRMIRLASMQAEIRKEYSFYFPTCSSLHVPSVQGASLVSMHFRFGDYKNLQQYHNLLPYEYYLQSVKHMRDHTTTPFQILYFCEREDNPIVNDIIGRLHKEYPDIPFMKADDTIPDWKQMLLMSCCDSHIIANSTYSWWGAYFNMSPTKQVCYPSKWFGPANAHHNVEDMFMPSWTRIDI